MDGSTDEDVVRRLAYCCLALGAATTVLGAPRALADPTITIDPNPARTGHKVTFTASPPDPGYSWDLNGDGVYGDQTGFDVTWDYGSPGTYVVGVLGPGATQPVTDLLPVHGPSAAFASFPTDPVPGEQVTFVYSSTQATPPDAPPAWDLNGDGIYTDATGATARRTFPAPGSYPVGLEVTDLDGAISTSTQLITVKAPPAVKLTPTSTQLRLMSPFPIVRITGKIGRRGARIKRLTVNAPYGATVTVRCRGRGCPFHLSSRTVAPASHPAKGTPAGSAVVRIRKLEKRLLKVGANIKIYVSKSGAIGKFTRF